MGQYFLSKEEAEDLLEQRVHVLKASQELWNRTKNFVKIAGDYMGEESLLCRSMATWLHHIDRLEQKYDKKSVKDPIFREDLIVSIHKRVQVSLHFCNKT